MLTVAESIMATPDRTPKERRNMAEIRDIAPGGHVDWRGNCEVCYFNDGSALMMTFDDDLCPTEFLVINPKSVDAERAELLNYAQAVADIWRHLGKDEMLEQVEAHLESNYPEAEDDVIAGIVACVH